MEQNHSYDHDVTIDRYLTARIRADLHEKMVFLGGPRQVGKTTLAKRILRGTGGYLSWDDDEDRGRILRGELPPGEGLWVFDEIHKYRRWRNLLKGLFDRWRGKRRILVTGSARLDLYRYGGDSLQGRYHFLRLHPLSFAELGARTGGDLRSLLRLGGFPEPFLGQSERKARRWSREYRTRLVRDEVQSLERVQDLGRLELLMLRLPELVGSPLSLNALREDLQVSHRTVSSWVGVLERLYAVFRVPPFGHPRIRAVKKEQKHYHLDWTLVSEMPARFENLVGCHLLKWVHLQQDAEGRDVELRYFRDVDRREVDFVVVDGRNPVMLVECKWGDASPDPGLRYFKARFPAADAWQISAEGRKDFLTPEGIRVCPATTLLRTLA
jgi:predicted AAA+ superfamily ATPase